MMALRFSVHGYCEIMCCINCGSNITSMSRQGFSVPNCLARIPVVWKPKCFGKNNEVYGISTLAILVTNCASSGRFCGRQWPNCEASRSLRR